MAKKRMPIYGIIGIFTDFLAHNSAKYQYFSMIPSSFVSYYQIKYSLLVVGQFLFKCRFYGQKTVKTAQNWPYKSVPSKYKNII